jgi:hypothetical protein
MFIIQQTEIANMPQKICKPLRVDDDINEESVKKDLSIISEASSVYSKQQIEEHIPQEEIKVDQPKQANKKQENVEVNLQEDVQVDVQEDISRIRYKLFVEKLVDGFFKDEGIQVEDIQQINIGTEEQNTQNLIKVENDEHNVTDPQNPKNKSFTIDNKQEDVNNVKFDVASHIVDQSTNEKQVEDDQENNQTLEKQSVVDKSHMEDNISQPSKSVLVYTIYNLTNDLYNILEKAINSKVKTLRTEILHLLNDTKPKSSEENKSIIDIDNTSQPSKSIIVYTIYNLIQDLHNIFSKSTTRIRIDYSHELLLSLKENYFNSLAEEQLEVKANHYQMKKLFIYFITNVRSNIKTKKVESYHILKTEQYIRYRNYKLKLKVFTEIKNYCFIHKRWVQSIQKELRKTTLL